MSTVSQAPGIVREQAGQDERTCFLCASAQPTRIARLSSALAATGSVTPAPLDIAPLLEQIAATHPALLFLDFDAAVDSPGIAQAVRRAYPALPVVALGPEAAGDVALTAMRAGARDLLDIEPQGAAPEAMHIAAVRALDRVSRLIAEPVAAQTPTRRGKLIVLLGARAGAGASTLAANLSVLLQKRLTKRNASTAGHEGAALLDLGLPAADSTLLLDTPSELHFHDAVRNLRRFDQTFVHTAFARHTSGLALMTLPADLAEMRTISYAAAVRTLDALRAFFDYQIVDLGGFSNMEFVSHVVDAADTVWLVCDANVASAVSAASLCKALDAAHDEHATSRRKPELIVNKYDPTGHLAAEALAARLDLPLAAVLPARAQTLNRAVNQGQLLSDSEPNDPYVRAVDALAAQIAGDVATASGDAMRASLARLSGKLFKRG